MKCTKIISTWYSTGMGQKVNNIVCTGEMAEVGKIDNYSLGLEIQILYQCPSCKTIKIT
jgi:hypothetical protein